MSLTGYDLDRIGSPIGKLANAQEKLAKAEERKADALAVIANAIDRLVTWKVGR